MSRREITLGDWSERELLKLKIVDYSPEGKVFRYATFELTAEESRGLERLLHERNAERDE